jgi:hypothetical protein
VPLPPVLLLSPDQQSVQDISNHLETMILNNLQAIAPQEEKLLKSNSYLLQPNLIKMRKKRKKLFLMHKDENQQRVWRGVRSKHHSFPVMSWQFTKLS